MKMKLEPSDYWELRARFLEAERAQVAFQEATKTRNALIKRLGIPDGAATMLDATCEVIVQNAGPVEVPLSKKR